MTGSRVNFVLTAPRNRAVHAAVGVGGRPRTFPSAAARPLHPPTQNQPQVGQPVQPVCLPKPRQLEPSKEGKPDTYNRDERGAAMFQVGRLPLPTWSISRVSQSKKKKWESNTEIFQSSSNINFFWFESGRGPIKEPCEGPLEKASLHVPAFLTHRSVNEARQRAEAKAEKATSGRAGSGPSFPSRVGRLLSPLSISRRWFIWNGGNACLACPPTIQVHSSSKMVAA